MEKLSNVFEWIALAPAALSGLAFLFHALRNSIQEVNAVSELKDRLKSVIATRDDVELLLVELNAAEEKGGQVIEVVIQDSPSFGQSFSLMSDEHKKAFARVLAQPSNKGRRAVIEDLLRIEKNKAVAHS